MINIIISDDQVLFRSMLEEIVKKDTELNVVSVCNDGNEVISALEKYKVDFVLLDIGMPNKGGIETLLHIKENYKNIKVVMLTTFEDDNNIKEAITVGADGYLVKDIKPEILLMAIKCIANDLVIYHKSVVQSFLSNAIIANLNDEDIRIEGYSFSKSEINIIKCIANGMSNKEIGLKLNYTEGTIKNKISKILATTSLSDRTEITVFAIKNRII